MTLTKWLYEGKQYLVRIPYQLKRRLCNVLSVFEEI